MARIGHASAPRRSSAAAIAVAAAGTPVPLADAALQDDHGLALGSQVSITSDNFGPEASEGELVAATRMHYTIRRTDARAGTVHVHFPRIGYALRAVKTL